VILPMITPAIFFATTMTLITSFQVFAQPYILTQGGPGNETQTMVMYVYNQGWQFLNMGLASAAAWVLFVIIMAITAIQFAGQKRWVRYDV
jgi:multiple sugar transport system permease protein